MDSSVPRFLLAGITALAICACGGPEVPDERQNKVPDPVLATESRPVITNTDDPKEWIRKRYERTLQMEQAGQLNCDTITYACEGDARYGSFVFCYSDGVLMRATHEMTEGDHFGVTERYFYDGEELYFAYLTQGSWHFGGPMQTDEAGHEVPGTIDEVHEERRYFDRGDLIDRLYKDYTITSAESSPTPDEIPNRQEGEGVDAELGSDAVLRVADSGSYDCR